METMGDKIGLWGRSTKVRHALLCQEVTAEER